MSHMTTKTSNRVWKAKWGKQRGYSLALWQGKEICYKMEVDIRNMYKMVKGILED